MSYTKEPLIIKPIREIPQEVMFNLKHAERDVNKPNRLWFKFPENWSQTIDKDCVIGIRDMFVAQSVRHLNLKWTAIVYKKDNPDIDILEHTFFVETFLTNNNDLDKLMRYTYQWTSQQIKVLQAGGDQSTALPRDPKDPSGDQDAIKALKPYRMSLTYNKGYPKITLYNDMNNEQTCKYGIKIKSINIEDSDFNKLMVIPPFEHGEGPIYYNSEHTESWIYFGWDRRHLYLTSSISVLTNDNYLGHTDRVYTPIKYYRMHSNDQKFWIDCWSTYDHDVLSILPTDCKDEFIIEALVCFDSSALI